MEIKNLSQLKKAINNKMPFKIIEHFTKPEHTGEIRLPNVLQTNAFYSVELDKPNSPVSMANNGKGYYLEYKKANNWKFNGKEITYLIDEEPILTITFEF